MNAVNRLVALFRKQCFATRRHARGNGATQRPLAGNYAFEQLETRIMLSMGLTAVASFAGSSGPSPSAGRNDAGRTVLPASEDDGALPAFTP